MHAISFTRSAFYLLTSCVSMSLANPQMGWAEALHDDTPAFRFQLRSDTENPHCVATQLQSSNIRGALQVRQHRGMRSIHALTAAHCFRGPVDLIHIVCRNRSSSESDVTSFISHPTHDAVLLQLLVEESCLGTVAATTVQAVGEPNQRLDIPVPIMAEDVVPGVMTPEDGRKRHATIISVDEETLRLADQVACLRAGDSGHPFLSDGKLVGMLISGSEGCPTEQIAIRIDRLEGWIGGHVH